MGHPSLSTWYLGTYPLVREELLPPDLGHSKDRRFKPQCLASSQSFPQWHVETSFCLCACREGESHSLP